MRHWDAGSAPIHIKMSGAAIILRATKNHAAAVATLLFATVLQTSNAICGQNGSPPPLPPERPASLSGPVMTPSTGAVLPMPQPTNAPQNGSVTPPAPPKALDEPIRVGVYNDGPGTAMRLPSASHARMHQCAVEWQNIKAAGAAEGKTWFNFALKCLTR